MAEICVFAQFPVSGQSGSLDTNSDKFQWIHCLTFPVAKLNQLQLSFKPYKWIRYATGVVVGAHGELSSNRESTVSVDYDATLPSEHLELYYHTTDQERARMFPLEPQLINTKITSSVATSHRAKFRDEVSGRDGDQCVLSGMPNTVCDAAHLLPHRRGDLFIHLFTEGRSLGGNVIEDIDDVRNGVFISKVAHAVFGTDLAILKTPNFAMKTSDVVFGAVPDDPRYTPHFFDSRLKSFDITSSEARLPPNLAHWPPDILFDAVYGSAVLKHFGTIDKDRPRDAWRDIFYPDQDNYRRRQDKDRAEPCKRFHDRSDNWTWDALALGPYMFMPPEELKALVQRRREEKDAADRKELESKIGTWRNEVGP